jgi:hypothetical protein
MTTQPNTFRPVDLQFISIPRVLYSYSLGRRNCSTMTPVPKARGAGASVLLVIDETATISDTCAIQIS